MLGGHVYLIGGDNGYHRLDHSRPHRRGAGQIHHAGRDPGGIIVTILIGIAGALIGGYISTRMGYGAVDGIDLRSILIAVGGAIILLFLFRLIRRGA